MQKNHLTLTQAVEWRAPLWSEAITDALKKASPLVPEGGKVLEIGFNSGLMSCYLATHYEWHIEGHELSQEQVEKARRNATLYSCQDRVTFNCTPAEKTFEIEGEFDAIFLKSILYHNKKVEGYFDWIHWLHSKLKPEGVLIAIENGQGHFLDRFYRNTLMNVSWKDNIFYSQKIEDEFKKTFARFDVNYFGGMSQYTTAFPLLCKSFMALESKIGSNADRCFIASIVAQR